MNSRGTQSLKPPHQTGFPITRRCFKQQNPFWHLPPQHLFKQVQLPRAIRKARLRHGCVPESLSLVLMLVPSPVSSFSSTKASLALMLLSFPPSLFPRITVLADEFPEWLC